MSALKAARGFVIVADIPGEEPPDAFSQQPRGLIQVLGIEAMTILGSGIISSSGSDEFEAGSKVWYQIAGTLKMRDGLRVMAASTIVATEEES